MAVKITPAEFSRATAALVAFSHKHDLARLDEVEFEERPNGLAIMATAPNGERFDHVVPAIIPLKLKRKSQQ